MTTDQQRIIETVERMTHALFVRDMDGIMACYESSATIVFEPGAPVSDPSQVREKFHDLFTITPNFEYINGHEVYVTGEIAVHIAPWHMTGKTADGTAITDTGLSIAVLRRQPDGVWLMIFDDPYGSHLMNIAQNL